MNWFGDLETTGLSGRNGDIILLGCFIPQDSDDVVIIANGDVPDDDGIVHRLDDFLTLHEDEDRVFGWNWFNFDLRFINDRLINDGGWPRAWLHQVDLKDKAKAMFPWLPDHKLDTVAHALGVPTEKTPLDLKINTRCANDITDKEAWDSLIEHCVHDIKVTREVFEKMYAK